MIRLSLLLTLAVLATPAVARDLTPAETARIDAVVADALAKSGAPSASIAVVRDGRIVLAKAYGKASETIPAARPDLPYQVASISKQFTAAALQLLENDGKLSLDDRVAKYLPDISGAETITLRQLLDHTSGLQDYWPQDYSFAAMATPTTPQGIVDRWAGKPLDFAPGSQWQYSNTGYVVAGMIVEKVSGQPLLSFLDARVFKPLGMASVIDQDKAIGPRFPQGYQRFALGPVRVEPPAADGWLYAAGELSMTASDLARWNIARLDRALLPADDWTAQETATRLTDGKDTGYGLGVSIGSLDGRRVIEHSGASVGFLSQNLVFPAERAAVTVLTNASFSNAYRVMAQMIARAILPASANADTAWAAKARIIFDQLRSGTLDTSLLTSNAAYYFTPTARADYKASLSAIGEPTGFTAVGQPRPRGGFVGRSYRVSYGDRALAISVFTEPGDDGRFEQFLVQPIQ